MIATRPLLNHTSGACLAWAGQRPISRERFLNDVAHVATALPDTRFAVNLCSDRYLFTVAFAAILVRAQTNLLPCSRLPHDIASARAVYPDSTILTDDDILNVLRDQYDAQLNHSISVPEIAIEHTAAITFTSGSTGESQPHPKTWGSLVSCAQLTQQRFALTPHSILLATAPPQHMYGLEASVMLPLISGTSIQRSRPLFPEDIRTALSNMPAPRVLITTPVHLRACCRTDTEWPKLDLVLSATAPLDTKLASTAETMFKAPVMEIYGCTEGGSLASRRTVEGNRWHLFDGVEISACDEAFWVSGGHISKPFQLNDHIEFLDGNFFQLLGRHSDMVNIAGKRASLSSLNYHLNTLEGVLDGVFLMPTETANENAAPQRLMALVVAPQQTEASIIAALATRIDAAFLPRPLYQVDRLPRNETGKLPQRELLALLNRIKMHA